MLGRATASSRARRRRNLGPGRPPRTLDHPGWYDGYLFARALTIGGGTGEVQRNIIAERVLGLPHDVDVQQGLSWSDAQRVRLLR